MHSMTLGRVVCRTAGDPAGGVPFRSPAMALDLGEWVPGLKLSPFFSQRVEYESNVFQVPSHSKDDIIFKMIPGFLADYTFGPHSVSAGYRAEILKYLDLTNQDTVHHIAVGQLRLDFPRTLLTLRDDFARTSDPPGTELTGRILSNTNVLKPTAEYRWTSTLLDRAELRLDRRQVRRSVHRRRSSIAMSTWSGPRCSGRWCPRATSCFNYSYGRVIFTTATERDYTAPHHQR